jgi:uncharacterized protein YhhL (DUF1145 family)
MRHAIVSSLVITVMAMTGAVPALAKPLSEPAPATMLIPIYTENVPTPESAAPPIGRYVQGGLGVAGAVIFLIAGNQMMGLRSVSGTSVAENYYQSMGVFSFGMAAMSLWAAMAAFTAD